jgi:hypothetical protein
MPPIEPYSEIEVRCEPCNLNKIHQSDDFTDEALEYLNGQSIGLLYDKFKCESCGQSVTLYTGEQLLFDKNNLRYCQIGAHPIPNPQLEINPDRTNCVHCDQENEDAVDVPPLVPQLINSQPCSICEDKREEDPLRYAHRTGRTEIRINNDDGNLYIACTLFQMYVTDMCSYRRDIGVGDQIENIDINRTQDLDIQLFRDEEINDDHELETQELPPEEIDLEDVLEKIENKFEELKGLIKELRELVDKNQN